MNQVTVVENKSLSTNFNAEKIALIKNTVAQGATDMELQLFIEQCKRTGLDPITRQIYFIKDHRGKVQVQTSIDGFRLVAERSGLYEGQTVPQWCDQDGKWVEVWLKKTPPAACKVGVYKRGFREALYAIAVFDEYAQRKADGSLAFMWAKMSALMISKVAESLALRKAFPNDLSGLYTQEEMAQATPVQEKQITKVVMPEVMPTYPTAEQAEAPQDADIPPQASWDVPANNEDPGSYVIPIGKKFKGMSLKDVPIDELASFAMWLQNKAQEENKPLQGQSAEFVTKVESFIRQQRAR